MNRLAFIDHIRNVANIIRCFIHAAVPYMVTASPIWPVDDEGYWIFDFLIFEGHLFVMELFYVVAGFMFVLQYRRQPLGSFLRNRFRRIAVPFAVALVFLMPVVLMLFDLASYKSYAWMHAEAISNAFAAGIKLGMDNFFPTGHLWFLYYLMLFYAITLLGFKNIIQPILQRITLPQFLLMACLISFSGMFFHERWIIENPLTFAPELTSFVHFFMFFLLGILLHQLQQHPLLEHGRTLIIAGIIVGLISASSQLMYEKPSHHMYDVVKIVARFSYVLGSYALTLGFWAYFKKHFTHSSPVSRFMADASYRIYLVNMPIVAILHLLILPIHISAFIKFLVVFVLAFALSVASYWLSRNFKKLR